jgi:hypothetical protein
MQSTERLRGQFSFIPLDTSNRRRLMMIVLIDKRVLKNALFLFTIFMDRRLLRAQLNLLAPCDVTDRGTRPCQNPCRGSLQL